MKEKILIIGNKGYLGSQLTEYLSSKKYLCKGIDINFFDKCTLFKPKKISSKIIDAYSLNENEIKKFDVVLLLAAFSNDPFKKLDPNLFYKPSEAFTYRIAKICKKYKIKMIFPSSCSVYGYGEKIFNEKSKLNPLTYYSKNKVNIENKLLKLSDNKFKPIILRLATVFGVSARMRFDLVINMFCGMAITSREILLNSNGLSWRPNIHIDDVCKSFEYFIKHEPNKKNLIYNIGKDQNNSTVINLAKSVKNEIKNCKISNLKNSKQSIFSDKKIQDGVDKRSYTVSFEKIRKLKPPLLLKYNLKKGIKKTIKDLKKEKLSKKKFKSIKFYRLQMYEKLFTEKKFSVNKLK